MERHDSDGWAAARDWGYLLLRAALAVIFIAHGGQKLFGWWGGPGWVATIQQFSQGMGIPAPLGALAILTEFFGGLAVLVGMLTRTAALGLFITMVVAAVMVHLPNGFFLQPGPGGRGPGVEYNLALGAMALFFVLAGPGRYALAGDTERTLLDRLRERPRAGGRAAVAP